MPESARITERYKVHPSLDTVLLFNEDAQRPVASVAMADIPTTTLNNVVATNQYLALPRLSSQDLLEGICPTEWNRPRKRLCVILVTANTDTHDEARQALRRIALESAFSSERVRFAYIYQEKQSEFVSALRPKPTPPPAQSPLPTASAPTTDGASTTASPASVPSPPIGGSAENSNNDDTLLRLVIIWRRDASHIKYEWVSDVSLHWSQEAASVSSTEANDDGSTTMTTSSTTTTTTTTSQSANGGNSTAQNVEYAYNHTKEKLETNIQRLLRSSEALSYEAQVKDLLDEHAIGILAHIVHRILLAFEYFADNVGREHILPVLSTIASIAFVIGAGYLMAYLVRVEEADVQKRANGANNNGGMCVTILTCSELNWLGCL